jgi:hypothetical protein
MAAADTGEIKISHSGKMFGFPKTIDKPISGCYRPLTGYCAILATIAFFSFRFRFLQVLSNEF